MFLFRIGINKGKEYWKRKQCSNNVKHQQKPKAITNAVLVNKGDLYSDLDRKRTYGYLSQLNSFKYPNIEYIENNIDSTLTTNIYLNPRKKYGLGFDFDISQSNIQKILPFYHF